MKKSILTFSILAASLGFLCAQQQKNTAPLQITKAELFSMNDIKPLILATNTGKSFASYDVVQSFKLTVTATENRAEGLTTISMMEPAPCGTLTEKQRAIIEKYGKQGVIFTLEGINMMEPGKPGTPYVPGQEKFFSVPDITFSVKE